MTYEPWPYGNVEPAPFAHEAHSIAVSLKRIADTMEKGAAAAMEPEAPGDPELLAFAEMLLEFAKGTITRAGLVDTNGVIADAEAAIARRRTPGEAP